MNSCHQVKSKVSGARRVLPVCCRPALWLGLLALLGLTVRAETPPLAATNLWKFPLASRYPYNTSKSTPALAADGTIYQATFDGTVFAIQPDGREQWRFKAGREIKSSPAIADDGTIYFGSRDRQFYAIAPDGKLKWQFATGAWVDSSPALAKDGTVYFGSWDKNFYALNPNGLLKWKLAIGGIVDSSPAIAADGTVYFGAHNKKFYAVSPDGKVRWTFPAGAEIISSPAIGAEGTIYFNSLDGKLYALTSDGKQQWVQHTGGSLESSPVLDENENIFLPVNNNTWSFSKAGKRGGDWPSAIPFEIPPTMVTGGFYVSRPWRTLNGISKDFQLLWVAELQGNLTAPPMVSASGRIYVVADNFLYAIQPPGQPRPPAKSSWPMFRADARHTGRAGNSDAK